MISKIGRLINDRTRIVSAAFLKRKKNLPFSSSFFKIYAKNIAAATKFSKSSQTAYLPTRRKKKRPKPLVRTVSGVFDFPNDAASAVKRRR